MPNRCATCYATDVGFLVINTLLIAPSCIQIKPKWFKVKNRKFKRPKRFEIIFKQILDLLQFLSDDVALSKEKPGKK